MFITHSSQIIIDHLRAVFLQNKKPTIGLTDFIGETATSGNPDVQVSADGSTSTTSGNDPSYQSSGQGNIEYDPVRRVVYPRSLFVYSDNILGTYGYDTGRPRQILWKAVSLPPTPTSFGTVKLAQGFYEMEGFYKAASAFSAVGYLQPEDGGVCLGFTSIMQIAMPPGYANSVCSGEVRWRVSGSSKQPRWYRVVYAAGGKVSLAYNDVSVTTAGPDGVLLADLPSETTWRPVDDPKIGSNLDDLLKQGADGSTPKAHAMEVRLLAGIITLKIGSQDTPYVWPHVSTDSSGTSDWYIDRFMVACTGVLGLSWSYHPTKFTTTADGTPCASYLSATTNVGFLPDALDVGQIAFTTHYAPFNSSRGDQITGNKNGITVEAGFRPVGCSALATYYTLQSPLPGDLPSTQSFTNPNGSGTTIQVNPFGIQYLLSFVTPLGGKKPITGEPYSNLTCCVRAVSFDIPAVKNNVNSAPYQIGTGTPVNGAVVDSTQFPNGLPFAEEFEIETTFDVSNKINTQRASFTVSNFNSIWTGVGPTNNASGFLDSKGHFSIAMYVGLNTKGSETATPVTTGILWPEFLGVANTRFTNSWQGSGRDKVRIDCVDPWLFLDVMAVNVPWLDGWNLWYAMYYLAALAGMDKTQMAFANLIPGRAFDDVADSFYDPRHPRYFLPVGITGTPLTKFDSGQNIKSIMMKIANALGLCMYFDLMGLLHIEKFLIAHPHPGDSIKTFNYYSGGFEPGGTYVANGIWSGSYSRDMTDVRNMVVVFGKSLAPTDSAWAQTGANPADMESVYNDTVFNYKGFQDALIWEDQIFASSGFSDKAAKSILDYLRIPDYSVNFQTWYQPENGYDSGGNANGNLHRVGTGQLIRINYPRTGASDQSMFFFVTATKIRIAKASPPTIDITARILPLPYV